MTVKKRKVDYIGIGISAIWIIASLALIFFFVAIWSASKTRDECGSLPLSAYINPDDTTPAKCYAMWKDGRL